MKIEKKSQKSMLNINLCNISPPLKNLHIQVATELQQRKSAFCDSQHKETKNIFHVFHNVR